MAVNQRTLNLVDKKTKRKLFPPACFLCGAECETTLALCRGCINDLPYNSIACPVCASPLLTTSRICPACSKEKKQPFNSCRTLFVYRFPINQVIKKIKYDNHLEAARCLGLLMATAFANTCADRPQCIIPVPLHASRLRQRGYNPALELARPIASKLDLAINTKTCIRTKPTRPQSQLTARQRKQNVRDAFAIVDWPGYQHIVIFDDVMTTGATCRELARTFRKVGVATIEIWACARARR